MRFAWLRKKEGVEQAPPLGPAGKSVLIAYNAIWWVPLVLGFLEVVSYRAAFISFLAITVFRALANLYRNNVLPIEAGQRFALRSP